MKQLIALIGILIVGTIKADAGFIVMRPQQQPQPDSPDGYRRLQLANYGQLPKAIVIGSDAMPGTDQSVNQIINAIQNNIRSDSNSSDNVPEVVFTDPDQQVSDPQQGNHQTLSDVVERVYRLPATTRLIATEQQEDNTVKDQTLVRPKGLWRSPIPFLHGQGCHHHKQHRHRNRHMRTKGRQLRAQTKRQTTTTTTTTTSAPEPIPDPSSLLAHLIASRVASAVNAQQFNSIDGSDGEPSGMPTAIIMSISSQPNTDNTADTEWAPPSRLPLMSLLPMRKRLIQSSDRPSILPILPALFAAIQRRRLAQLQSLQSQQSQQLPQFLQPLQPLTPSQPFNPFLSFLARLRGPIETFKSSTPTNTIDTSLSSDLKKVNFNFNVNLTINNNYGSTRDEVRQRVVTNNKVSKLSALLPLFANMS